ncbi:hypothetical protein GOODEAATRI_022846, partial [Goodea atripinnis]
TTAAALRRRHNRCGPERTRRHRHQHLTGTRATGVRAAAPTGPGRTSSFPSALTERLSPGGFQDSGPLTVQQPEKAGWIRKFCGRGIFRELWRSRYVVLKGDHLYISDKEVKDERKAQEVFDLADYERSEELRKAKSRSKKNHSRFTLLRCKHRGNTVSQPAFLHLCP